MKSPIIHEVRAAREALAEKFDFDLHRICEDAMRRQTEAKTVPRKTVTKRRSETKVVGKEMPPPKQKSGDR